MKKSSLLLLAVIALSSCSLKYEDPVIADEKVPEFLFNNTSITRYEDKKITVEINAESLEQYKNSSETFAKNVHFKSYNSENEVGTEGSCGYLFTDTESKIYELYDDIQLFDKDDKINFFADVLKWNARNEQLTSGRGNMVRIEKDGTIMYGSGFSASGISKKFVFSGTVTGDINTK